MGYLDNSGKRKRVAVIGVSSFLLVAMVVAVTVGVGLNNKSNASSSGTNQNSGMSASIKAIKAICQPTDFQQTCEENLKQAAGNTTDPKELVKAAFKVAVKFINDAANNSTTLQQLNQDARTHAALTTCKELMNMSIAELEHSFEKVGSFDISKLDDIVEDLRTWLSASMTYQETCLDGFENTTTDAGEKMKAALKTGMELTSNGLDIVSSLSSILSSMDLTAFSSRRLLQDDQILGHGGEMPTWVDYGTRRLLSTPASSIQPDIVVAKDGSGNFTTIEDAMMNIPKKPKTTFVLYIKAGVYNEYLEFNSTMSNLLVIGDGPQDTRITGNKNFVDGTPTYHTATVVVLGDNFMAKNIGIENTAGAIKHQAVALRVSADYAIFDNCAIDGYQDTLYAHSKRQFYRDTSISGTIDFVFGDSAVVFQNCKFLIRQPLDNQQNIVTAQGRKQRRQPSGIVIQNSTITAHPDFVSADKQKFKSYLGRPWKEYSRTIIMESYIDSLINPDGWLPWMGTFGLKTCWYAEFNNYGPGSSMAARVKWNGIKTLNKEHAIDFTPGRFISGDSWIKPTGVPYVSSLTRS